jgi:MFS transporter, ACS family, glucarate transporter
VTPVRQVEGRRRGAGTLPIRWIVLAMLFLAAAVMFVQRMCISVAAPSMQNELGLSPLEMGWVFSSFLVGYVIFQVPGALYGERFGARRSILWLGLIAIACTLLTAAVPGHLGVAPTLVFLLLVRFVLGASQAPVFPVGAGVILHWFPPGRWSLPNALITAGISLGAAATPPLLANLIDLAGWRTALAVVALLAGLFLIVWWPLVRDRPEGHPRITPEELAFIGKRSSAALDARWPVIKRLLGVPQIVSLSLSYLLQCYVIYVFIFWLYPYLTVQRGLTLVSSGTLAAVPFIAAAIVSPFGSALSDWLVRRGHARWGFRAVPMIALTLAAGALWLAVQARDPYIAVLHLSVCFALVQVTDGVYWGAMTTLAPSHAPIATGILNTFGNVGGVICTPLIPWVAERLGWVDALLTSSVAAVLGAGLWLLVTPDRPVDARIAAAGEGEPGAR